MKKRRSNEVDGLSKRVKLLNPIEISDAKKQYPTTSLRICPRFCSGENREASPRIMVDSWQLKNCYPCATTR